MKALVTAKDLEDLRAIRDRGSNGFSNTRLRVLAKARWLFVEWTRVYDGSGPRRVPSIVKLTKSGRALVDAAAATAVSP